MVIRAVTVDAHGVLIIPDPTAINAVLEQFSCQTDEATCWEAHYRMIRLLDLTADPDWPTMNRSFAEALGVDPSDQDDAGAMLAERVYLGTSWIPAPGASAGLARLAENGFGAAVVSNTVHGELAELLSRTGMCEVDGDLAPVAAIIDSRRVGVEKPDPRPFQMALQALNEPAANVVHVGDSLHSDVVGALGAGMSVVHIDPLSLCDDHRHEHSFSFEAFVSDLINTTQEERPGGAYF
jgi:putative hydrolase of the HAD superfamily